jgi:SAM-dependent methyltransferase
MGNELGSHDRVTRIDDVVERRAAERAARRRVVPWLTERYAPQTVLDVGCGIGTWAAAFLEIGCDVLAIDGAQMPDELLQIPRERFRVIDFEREIDLPRRFDMAVCLEVAEHLTASAGQRLVNFLTRTADVIVFSAAIPGQGGYHHLTERWPHYWQELFAVHGYTCDDEIRWAYWDDESVEWWYRQNMFVARRGEGTSSPLRSVVHPALLESTLDDFYAGRVGLRVGGVVFVRALVYAAKSRVQRRVVRGHPIQPSPRE